MAHDNHHNISISRHDYYYGCYAVLVTIHCVLNLEFLVTILVLYTGLFPGVLSVLPDRCDVHMPVTVDRFSISTGLFPGVLSVLRDRCDVHMPVTVDRFSISIIVTLPGAATAHLLKTLSTFLHRTVTSYVEIVC